MKLTWLYVFCILCIALVAAHAGLPSLCCFFTEYSRAILSPIDELERMPLMWAVLYTVYDAIIIFFRFCMLLMYPVCRLAAPPHCLCCK